MPRPQQRSEVGKIVDYFRTAPDAEARIAFALVQDVVKDRFPKPKRTRKVAAKAEAPASTRRRRRTRTTAPALAVAQTERALEANQ